MDTSLALATKQPFALTADQEAAMNSFMSFIMDPVETVWVLEGFAGCGKTTLVMHLLEQVPKLLKAVKLVSPNAPDYEVMLTATTNKACEALRSMTKSNVSTIHSALGLTVRTDYSSGRTELKLKRSAEKLYGKLLFIDEASFIDSKLLEWIFRQTDQCKIIFIGDPAQLAPVNCSVTPVFASNFSGAKLTQTVRQTDEHGNPQPDHPITALATMFRHQVETGEPFQFEPDGEYVVSIDHETAYDLMLEEFGQPDWSFSKSKVLAWTNRAVDGYNKFVRGSLQGEPKLQEGDYAICNSFITLNGGQSIKTDQMVEITKDLGYEERYGYLGRRLIIDGFNEAFLPDDLSFINQALKEAQREGNWVMHNAIERSWIDLRAAYACTINKSQGSTFDKVFIDLTDVSKCRNADTLARMLYVAVSRARTKVYLIGDLV